MYITPKIKNNIINIIAHDVLQKDLIDEIQTILVDEVESHYVEQLPLCIRFVDDKKNIRE